MVVLLSVSSRLERALGTLPMAWVLLVTFTVLPGLLFVAVASLLDAIIGTSFSNFGMCGFDPVIFASIVLLSSQEGTGSFRLFGSYSIQAVYFPWLLFVVCALFSSFSFVLLNGAGMAIGYLYVRGKLDLITPSPDFFLRAETETRVGRWVAMNAHNFIGVDAATGLQSTLSGWLPVWSADVSDAQERGAASSPLSSPPAYQTGSSSHSTSEGTAREPLFPGQGHKLGA
ncbi:hypothetical protein BGW42_003100 [Actinomortierella wolfii]|nr:hypothetical protein BGW42_003100 [Actinomortierella wolfii]